MAWTLRWLEDIAMADAAFEVDASSVEEVFLGATEALLQSLANPVTVSGGWERSIERTDMDLSALLFDWLSEIVYWKDAAGVVFREAPLTLAQAGDVWLLQARLIGAPVDYRTQELHADVKGVTKHLYHVTEEAGRWKALVVLDV
ncbi:MAG: archease [Nitrospirota bacterium]|nr:archease [Nitrospirota bacterium]MDP2383551.1 archease [Nitrospirota bacterium]MDP3595370.1 archease [Nitrospirota bacterium]